MEGKKEGKIKEKKGKEQNGVRMKKRGGVKEERGGEDIGGGKEDEEH